MKTLSPAFFARDEHARRRCSPHSTGLAAAIIAGFVLSSRFDANGVAASIALGAWCCAGVLLLARRQRVRPVARSAGPAAAAADRGRARW